MMIDPDNASREIRRRNVPVVYIDTCSILDITRGRVKDLNVDKMKAVLHILELAELTKITLVFPEQVINELNEHLDHIKDECSGIIKSLNTDVADVSNVLRVISSVTLPPIPLLPDQEYVNAAGSIIDRLRRTAIVTATTDCARLKASSRVEIGFAPASTGKQSMKDCIVLESCYETLRIARGQGYSKMAFFLSANTAEYGDDSKKSLHNDLTPEFDELDMEFMKHFGELRYSNDIKSL